MADLTDEQKVFLTDEMYLPIEYKGVLVAEPHYNGDGEMSVKELEEFARQAKEYMHQQNVIKQGVMRHFVNLKFGIKEQ